MKSSSKSKSNRNRIILPYNNKLKPNEIFNKSTNKKDENKILNQRNKTYEMNDSIKNDSLSNLRKYIPSPKPYMVTSSIRKKIKDIKMIKSGVLDTFHSSTIKSCSASTRYKNNILLNKYIHDNYCNNNSKNKPFIINNEKRNINSYANKHDNMDKGHQANYDLNNNKDKKNYISDIKSIYFSNSKTDYSSLPTAALTSRQFYPKSKQLRKSFDNKKNYFDDSLGYNNANVQEPTYAKKGIIRSFMNEIADIRKDNYKNYYLKLHEFKQNILNENLLCQIQLDERTKRIAYYYLNKYSDGYNIYWYKLKKRINKEYDINDNLKYEIKNLKTEISKLTIKIQKKLIKLSIIIEIKDFLFELKEFSSYPCGTSYNQLMELKNKLMEKIENNEEQTNLNIYLLNNKEIGIDLFISKYKASLKELEIKKNKYKDFFSASDKFVQIPNELDDNIKTLLWKKNMLEKDIDSLKISLGEMIEESNNEQIAENTVKQRYNNYIKNIAHLKTENKRLYCKIELMKRKEKNDTNGKLNKNIGIRIMNLFNDFVKYDYITEKDNYNLNKNISMGSIKYLLVCLTIIERNIINLLKFKKEVIYKDPMLKKKFELDSKCDAVCRKKIKEQNERLAKIKKTMEKLNKVKYIKEQKDYYNLNSVFFIKRKKEKILSKEKEKDDDNTKRKKTPLEIMMDII